MKVSRTLLAGSLIGLLLALLILVTWALFWPASVCSDPTCSRKRFDLFVELDAFRGVESIPLEVDTESGPASAVSILRSGGIGLHVQTDDEHLPYSPVSGPLDRADLYQYALTWRNLAPPSRVDGQIYALVAPSIVSDRGEPLFGIMFDSAGREGIAIAPLQTVRTFERTEPDSIPVLQLRTFVHELLHALNRRHADAVQMPDGRLTLEAPTRCLMQRDGHDWRLSERPLLALSPGTIRFFQTAAPRDVLPGGTNTPFSGVDGSATECDDARSSRYEDHLSTRWALARRRLLALFGIASAHAQAPQDASDADPLVALRVQAQEAAYPLAYPIAIRVTAKNLSERPLPIKNRLTPAYGLVHIEHRVAGEKNWRPFRPLAWFETANDEDAMLAPGEQSEQTSSIYFGDDGWTFPEPGTYEIRARLIANEDRIEAVSNVVSIRVDAPESDAERAALELLLDDAGMLDARIGRWLIFGGRIGELETQPDIAAAIEQYSDTALGSALRLTLASQRLRPPIDPLTGERPLPDLSAVRALLDDMCTDSGLAALKHEMLMRFAHELPASLTRDLLSPQQAWDGLTRDGTPVPTYSDPTLTRLSLSFHFCPNDTTLAAELHRVARHLARTLARTKPERIMLVGHTDAIGTCRLNDELGLLRAEALQRIFVDAGIASERIQAVSLGERRPLRFSSSDEARALNRRVEILIARDTADELPSPDEVERVMPQCPSF